MSKNQRQMPKTTDYLSNPLFWDLVYAYIQVHSEWDGVVGHPRILKRKDEKESDFKKTLKDVQNTKTERHQVELDMLGAKTVSDLNKIYFNL